MKGKNHLLINAIILVVLFYFINLFFKYNVLDYSLLQLAEIFCIYFVFSLLPDIDSKKSMISNTLFLFLGALSIYGVYEMSKGSKEGIAKILIAIALAVVHFFVSDSSKNHRSFPHTFTFGIISSIAVWVMFNYVFALIAFFCFTLHLILDLNIINALKHDFDFWKKMIKKLSSVF